MGTLVNGIKEIFATAKTNGSNVMLCGNDGTPDGHMTMDSLANALGGKGLIRSKVIQIQPNESVRLGVQCDCVLVHADMRYFNGNKMVSVDTNGIHVVFDKSSQGGFDSYLRFFGNNAVWVENISSITLKIGVISFFETYIA